MVWCNLCSLKYDNPGLQFCSKFIIMYRNCLLHYTKHRMMWDHLSSMSTSQHPKDLLICLSNKSTAMRILTVSRYWLEVLLWPPHVCHWVNYKKSRSILLLENEWWTCHTNNPKHQYAIKKKRYSFIERDASITLSKISRASLILPISPSNTPHACKIAGSVVFRVLAFISKLFALEKFPFDFSIIAKDK